MLGRSWLRTGLFFVGAVLLGAGLLMLLLSFYSDPSGDDPPTPRSAIGGPCAYKPINAKEHGLRPLRALPEKHSRGRHLDTSLTVKYTRRSEVSLAGCPLHLRSYNGGLGGPTLRLQPGDTLNLRLRNRLPPQSPAEVERQFRQEVSNAHIAHRPVPFNTTNVHYHGLHVSPGGHSDNVYLEIKPNKTVNYKVELPADHPPGTYWYHPHGHGSTAIQVGGGMAGALIVEDNPHEIPAALRAANRREKVMLFQTILYDTEGELDELPALFPGQQDDPNCTNGLPTCRWQGSRRRTTINSQIVPKIHMRPGEIQRWRMIDATFSESLFLQLEDHPLHEIALDGNYLGTVDTWSPEQHVHLEPGYRSDVLVQASDSRGTYDLVDKGSAAKASLRGVAEDPNIIARVVVSGEPMSMKLPTDAQMASLAPFPDLENIAEQATGVETVVFKLGHDPKNSGRFYFTVNYAPFSPDHVRTLFLNHVDEWRIGTVGDDDGFPTPAPSPTASPPPQPLGPVPHVFHIHVNPFQVVREDPEGKSEPVWKDTLLVDGAPVSIYTKYTDFTGEFVIHCHILDHEDLGMMEAVRVVREKSLDPESPHH